MSHARKIEQRWIERANAQGLKPRTKSYRNAEIEFFAGAMSALDAAFPNTNPDQMSAEVPVIWVINAMSGRPVVDVTYDAINRNISRKETA